MTNKELSDFISSDNLKKASDTLIDKTEEIIGGGVDVVTSVFFGLPSYSLLKPFIDGLRDWKSRVELKQLAYFLKEFENLDQNARSEFSYMIQQNDEDFTERLFYYVSQLNDKKKAKICGKIGVAYARKQIPELYFFRIISIISKASHSTLVQLRLFLDRSIGWGPLGVIENRFQYSADEIYTSTEILRNFPGLKSQLISLGLYYEITEYGEDANQIKKITYSYIQFKDGIRSLGKIEVEALYIVYFGIIK